MSDISGHNDQPVKVNLLGLSPTKLETFIISIGEKSFRAHQIVKWIHHFGVEKFDDMTNLSKSLRETLDQIAEIKPPELVRHYQSADGTSKWLIQVSGGSCIETVFIPENSRGTLCISSQVGCSLDCSFCATGKQGFQRDLTSSEIIGQLWLASRTLNSFNKINPRAITNVVFMGMGEPLLNFQNVIDAINIMLNDNAYGLSKRRITLSTSGVVPMIDELGKHTDISLAISLHAPNDQLRNKLVPINKKYPIKMLLDSANRYLNGIGDKHRKITIEYILIDDVNDSTANAQELANLLKSVPCKINLIPFNPFANIDYKRSLSANIEKFRKILVDDGYVVTIRKTRGDDIDAACGQLAGLVNDRTQRSSRYQNQCEIQEQEAIRFVEGY